MCIEVGIAEEKNLHEKLAGIAPGNDAAQAALNAFFAPDGEEDDTMLSFKRTNGGVTMRFSKFTSSPTGPFTPFTIEDTPQSVISDLERGFDRLLGLIAESAGDFDPEDLAGVWNRLMAAMDEADALWTERMEADSAGADQGEGCDCAPGEGATCREPSLVDLLDLISHGIIATITVQVDSASDAKPSSDGN